MSLLRIHASIVAPPLRCAWALVNDGRDPVVGEGLLAEIPRQAARVQLVIPAAQVLLARTRLPPAAKQYASSLLAFAVEEQTAGEPDGNQVSWLGRAGEYDVLAVVDKPGLLRWRDALAALDIRDFEIHCETLLLPWTAGTWSLAWNGVEGFVRTGEFEGAATDCGDRVTPPLSLRLMLDEAVAQHAQPSSITLHANATNAIPDADAWTRELGIVVRLAGIWDWRSAPVAAGISLTQERQRWSAFVGMARRLRPALWILGAALAIHAMALFIERMSLVNEQRSLREQMVSRFRLVFPEAIAVTDPGLQMRRKLAEARHAAGLSDSSDFLPMIAQVAAAARQARVGSAHVVSFESGRMTLEFSAADEAGTRQIAASLLQSGLSVDMASGSSAAGSESIVLSVRAP